MPKRGHSEEQIVKALTAQEGGEGTKKLCRRRGISTATFAAVESRVRQRALRIQSASDGGRAGRGERQGPWKSLNLFPRRVIVAWLQEGMSVKKQSAEISLLFSGFAGARG